MLTSVAVQPEARRTATLATWSGVGPRCSMVVVTAGDTCPRQHIESFHHNCGRRACLGRGTMVARIGFVSVSAQARPSPDPQDREAVGSQEHSGPEPGLKARPARPLVVTGGIAACAAAASGLAVLTTLTAIGWITAPHVGIGTGLTAMVLAGPVAR